MNSALPSKPVRPPTPPGPSVVSSGGSGGSVVQMVLVSQTSGFNFRLPGVSVHSFPNPLFCWVTVTSLSTERTPVPQLTLHGPGMKETLVWQSCPRMLRKDSAPPVNHKKTWNVHFILRKLPSCSGKVMELETMACAKVPVQIFQFNLLSEKNSFTGLDIFHRTGLSHSIQAQLTISISHSVLF